MADDPPRPRRNSHEMHAAVERRAERRARWQQEGERSIWQNMSMIGALGWLIVVPTLIGLALGRWLDEAFDRGITFTAAGILVGVLLGGYLAWKRIHAP